MDKKLADMTTEELRVHLIEKFNLSQNCILPTFVLLAIAAGTGPVGKSDKPVCDGCVGCNNN